MTRINGTLTPLLVGASAPDFSLPQTLHKNVALHNLRGPHQRLTVLVFYPMDWEPVSREQLTLYQEYCEEFEGFGARLLGISTDHVFSHEAFARDAQIHFPLLADFHRRGSVAQAYGVYRDAAAVSARALFVVDERQVIRFGQVYPDALNPGVGELLSVLETFAQQREDTEGSS
jgi:peroxiredoxin